MSGKGALTVRAAVLYCSEAELGDVVDVPKRELWHEGRGQGARLGREQKAEGSNED
jgi:hypothetical protein